MAKAKFQLKDKVIILKTLTLGTINDVQSTTGNGNIYYVNCYSKFRSGWFRPTDLQLVSRPTKKKTAVGRTKPEKGELVVSEKFLKEAYEAACPEWKKKLEKQFPSHLKPEGLYNFPERLEISTSSTEEDCPIEYVGWGVLDRKDEGKYLVIRDGWKIVTKTYHGMTLLGFEIK